MLVIIGMRVSKLVSRLLRVVRNAAIIGDEADGNSQPFREFHSITQRHRGRGGDYLRCAAYCHHMKEVENAQGTSDHHGR